MDERKRKALEKQGWKIGSTAEFLDLSKSEAEYVEVKAALAHALSSKRRKMRLSQNAVASKLDSSQSRVAKMEAGDHTVSLDLLIRSFLKLGASTKELGQVISSAGEPLRKKRVVA
ncbi:MAG: XRE family transcriptional regulator [Deltaproteobacteria bacterium]|nr:XRE family transcriptional regulator [Deltaproteobacteria bacterium]